MNAAVDDRTGSAGAAWGWRRVLVCTGVFAFVWLVAYIAAFESLLDDMEGSKLEMEKLKAAYLEKKMHAVSLDLLRVQLREVEQMAASLQVALPPRFDTQFVEVMQTARAHGLRIDHLQLIADELAKGFYAELTGSLRVSGPFHDLGAFVGELASKGTIVALQDLKIESAPTGGGVSMDATVKAYRYLDHEEVAAMRETARASQKGPALK